MNVNGNGQRPQQPQQLPEEEIDYPRLVGDLSAQIGGLTTEVLGRGQIIDRLRGEVAQLREAAARAAGQVASAASEEAAHAEG